MSSSKQSLDIRYRDCGLPTLPTNAEDNESTRPRLQPRSKLPALLKRDRPGGPPLKKRCSLQACVTMIVPTSEEGADRSPESLFCTPTSPPSSHDEDSRELFLEDAPKRVPARVLPLDSWECPLPSSGRQKQHLRPKQKPLSAPSDCDVGNCFLPLKFPDSP